MTNKNYETWEWRLELNAFDRQWEPTPDTLDGERRYYFYRHKGLNATEALAAALAWERNREEQAARRATHDTGYQRKEYIP